MRIQCDECRATYWVADQQNPSETSDLRCKHCNHPITAPALTAQRSENSVLFSLDKLTAMVTGPTPATAGPMRAAPSTSAPASEGSGLIDIRAMRSMLDRDERGQPSPNARQPGEAIPSFGGGGFEGLSAAPIVSLAPPQDTSAATPKPKPRSSGPLLALVGVLGLGFLGLGALVLLDKPERSSTVEQVVMVAPEADASHDDDPELTAAQTEAEDEAEDDTKDDAEDPTEPEAEIKTTTPRKRTNPRTNPTTNPTKTPSKTNPTATKDPAGPIDVDCLLNKDLPKCKGKGGPGPVAETPTKTPTSPSEPAVGLPNKLSTTQIAAGISPVKSAAKSCGSGTTVAVKFSVAGSTGTVVSARPLDEHSSSAVGRCVVNAAKKASFPKFAAAQQGFTFKFRL